MRASAVAGIVFANINDDLLKKLTSKRSMASVPFGSRYRLIDFSLSNLVNAGVTNVGLITKENYRSLMDHVGSGVYWDLDRKSGGLYLLPPYVLSGVKRYTGTVDALYGAIDYIYRCKSDYIVLCNADTIANVDINSAINNHIENEADITLIYHNGKMPKNNGDTMILSLDKSDKVKEISFSSEGGEELNYGIGITIISRDLLLKIVKTAYEDDCVSLNRDVFAKATKQLKIYGWNHNEFVAVMDNINTYYRASMDLLNSDVRKQLFNKARPIYTKTRDDMPTKYGTKSDVTNCLVADGCVINGTVKNSILFRGVTVEKETIVENCILMQETSVKSGAHLKNVLADKNAVIGENMILKGTPQKSFFVKKNQII